MATPDQIQQVFLEQQWLIADATAQAIGQNFERVTGHLTGLTSAVYTQSVSQIVQSFNGEHDKFKEWVKSIKKYATLTRLGNVDIPRIAYQACTCPVGDFIRR